MSDYEYQGFDKFWCLTRGQVESSSLAKAKELVKGFGLRFAQTWASGDEPIQAYGRIGPVKYAPFLNDIKLKYIDKNFILYREKRWVFWIFGLMLMAGGILLIISQRSNLFIMACGLIFLAFGVVIFMHRLELSIERDNQKLTKKLTLIPPWFNRTEIIFGNQAEKVICKKEIFYGDTGEIGYVVKVLMNNQHIQLHHSSSRENELKLSEYISEYLNIPLECQDTE
ncbi:MAG: hypothetical protein GY869_21685 [Planctomycetes bacterium]|nr:hypothetical protein [Planctomycetota bacterium]